MTFVPSRCDAGARGATEAFARTVHGQGSLPCTLTDNGKTAMDVAVHPYPNKELAEIERIFHATPERGLAEEYLRVSPIMDTLPVYASTDEREEAIEAGLAFLEKIDDRFDARTGSDLAKTTSPHSRRWSRLITTMRKSPHPMSWSRGSRGVWPSARDAADRQPRPSADAAGKRRPSVIKHP